MRRFFVPIFLIYLTFVAATPGRAASDVVTIANIAAWQHPVKGVLTANNIRINRIELWNNKTYPVFDVSFPFDLKPMVIEYFSNVFKQTAAANGYWSYRFVDAGRKLVIDVVCDRKARQVSAVTINRNPDFYQKFIVTKRDMVMYYLNKNVPEIDQFAKRLRDYSKTYKEQLSVTYRLDGEPDYSKKDPYLRNYYMVYVGENHPTHTVRWNTFVVRQDLKDIMVDDPLSGKYITLAEWRRNRH